MGELDCNVAPSVLSQVVGQADQDRAEQSFPVVPDANRGLDID